MPDPDGLSPLELEQGESLAQSVRSDGAESLDLLSDPLPESRASAGRPELMARAAGLVRLADEQLAAYSAERSCQGQRLRGDAVTLLRTGDFASAWTAGSRACSYQPGAREGASLIAIAEALQGLEREVGDAGDHHHVVDPLRGLEAEPLFSTLEDGSEPIRELVARARTMREELIDAHTSLLIEASRAQALEEAWAHCAFLDSVGVRCEAEASLDELGVLLRNRHWPRILVGALGGGKADVLLARGLEILGRDSNQLGFTIRTTSEAELAAPSSRRTLSPQGILLDLAKADDCTHAVIVNLIDWIRDENDERKTDSRTARHKVNSGAVEQLIAFNTLGLFGDMEKTVAKTTNYQVIEWSRWVGIQVELTLTDLHAGRQVDHWFIEEESRDSDREIVVLSGTGIQSDPKQLKSYTDLERACSEAVVARISAAIAEVPMRVARSALTAAEEHEDAASMQRAAAEAVRARLLAGDGELGAQAQQVVDRIVRGLGRARLASR